MPAENSDNDRARDMMTADGRSPYLIKPFGAVSSMTIMDSYRLFNAGLTSGNFPNFFLNRSEMVFKTHCRRSGTFVNDLYHCSCKCPSTKLEATVLNHFYIHRLVATGSLN